MYRWNKLESFTKLCKGYEEREYYFIFPAENRYQRSLALRRLSLYYTTLLNITRPLVGNTIVAQIHRTGEDQKIVSKREAKTKFTVSV